MPQKDTGRSSGTEQKAEQEPFKNQNPNENHNTKKEALGPNTRRRS